MAYDELLEKGNPKKQVPTIVNNDGTTLTDSLLIALEYLPKSWHKSIDAKMFRLADSDVEAAIIFLFRANLLEQKFGSSDNSILMRKAGFGVYKSSVDFLIDHLLTEKQEYKCGVGAVLLLSTLLAAISLSEGELYSYRTNEINSFASLIEQDPSYSKMISTYQDLNNNDVPFVFSKFNKILQQTGR